MSSPFGNPDGLVGPFETEEGFVLLPPTYGPACRPAAEHSRVRVIAGTQGVGKTLFLRRLQAHYDSLESVNATPPTLKGRAMDTETVVEFCQLFPRTTNTEKWTIVWDRAIHLSAATYLVKEPDKYGSVDNELRSRLQMHVDQFFPDATTPRDPVEVAGALCRTIRSRDDFSRVLQSDNWTELSRLVQLALSRSRELYMFIDAIDDNYRYAPAYWQQCQRGLFHAVMDTQRTEVEASKLHVVISIRDLALSSIARGEHASRYGSRETTLTLAWTWESCTAFLNRKLDGIAEGHFRHPERKTLSSLLGRSSIANTVRSIEEPVEQYFLRHTRLSPRDIILLGNALVALSEDREQKLWQMDDADLRHEIAENAKAFAHSVLAQAANQVLSNVMPWTASRFGYADFYLSADEYTADAMVRELCSVIGHASSERFGHGERLRLESVAEKRFGDGCHLVDVLWQNRLLGVRTKDGPPRFYAGAFNDDVDAPDAEEYFLNSLLIDQIPSLALNSESPIFPGGRV